jgi:hypothetical protein
VRTLFEYLADGLSLGYFVETFPSVTREQAADVLRLSQQRRSRNCGDVLKKTPATRGTRRGRLGESGLFKVSVEVELVEELERVERTAQNNPGLADRYCNYQAYWRR